MTYSEGRRTPKKGNKDKKDAGTRGGTRGGEGDAFRGRCHFILLYYLFIYFSAAPRHMELPDQGSDPSRSGE